MIGSATLGAEPPTVGGQTAHGAVQGAGDRRGAQRARPPLKPTFAEAGAAAPRPAALRPAPGVQTISGGAPARHARAWAAKRCVDAGALASAARAAAARAVGTGQPGVLACCQGDASAPDCLEELP